MMKRLRLLIAAVAALGLSCSSDPEGPAAEKLMGPDGYPVTAGKTERLVLSLDATSVSAPLGLGKTPFLKIGRIADLRFEAILLAFHTDLSSADSLKTVSSAVLELPFWSATPADCAIEAAFHELAGDFADADSISAVPPYESIAIADSLGEVVRELTISNTKFSLDTAVVNGWIRSADTIRSMAVVWAAPPDTSGILEMNAREYGTNPAVIRLTFTDQTTALLTVASDYSVVRFETGGLNCVGGVARRIRFAFDPSALPERAMINAAFLVLTVRGDESWGVSAAEFGFGYSSTFFYYLYAPGSADTLSADFFKGTGVAQASFDPLTSGIIRMPVRGLIADVVRGARINTGLVLQSDLERSRVQRAAFASGGDNAPRIEIIYSLPAGFGGGT